jgi:SAM-dependent methyltransferase
MIIGCAMPACSQISLSHAERVARERDFHNHTFADETREAQGKYYAAIKHGSQAFDDLIGSAAANSDVLEYGCGVALKTFDFAAGCRSITGIDISDIAIDEARSGASARGISASFFRMNAESLEFPDRSFDLILGRGIIHHLDLSRAFGEIRRVLRPGGRAIFFEPLGHNRLINRYRHATPNARSVDEHPLLRADFNLARSVGFRISLRFYGLSTIATVPLRDTAVGDVLLAIAARLDAVLFQLPWVRWQAWYCLMDFSR